MSQHAPQTATTETHTDPTTGHEYDGIVEYDNPTPPWWTYIFILTTVYAVCYMMYYHGGNINNSQAAYYEMSVHENNKIKYAAVGTLTADEATLRMIMAEPSFLEMGRSVFRGNCVSCHGEDGGGGIGPNMHDDRYINVRELGDFLTVVKNGAGDGRMPEWGGRLENNDLILVSAYVASLRGTPASAPIEPQGEVIPAWDAPKSDAPTTPKSP